MNKIEQTSLEQVQITEFEIEHRKALFAFSDEEVALLLQYKPIIERNIDSIVSEFHRIQTNIAEILALTGNADILARLQIAERRYILDIFSGLYDIEYVNSRLRIGLVHKRIGAEPKLYLSAIHILKRLLHQTIENDAPMGEDTKLIIMALDKVLFFDVTLIFDMYLSSLVNEVETVKEKSDQYVRSMEKKVKERTLHLEEMSRTDPLTGLLNVRHFQEIVTTTLRSAQRRTEPVTMIYIDINEFKQINDSYGHQRGDEILCGVATAIKCNARTEDICIRYGGDEFCILLINCREEQANTVFVRRLNRLIAQTLGDLTLSIGIVQTGPTDYVDATTLLRMTDEKMYAAKQEYKKGVQTSKS